MNRGCFIKGTSLACFYLFTCLMATNTWALSACGSGSYANLELFSNTGGASFSVDWGVCGDNELEMKMTANGTGWIGVGFSEDSSMSSTDIVMGGVDASGNGYLIDTWASDRSSPGVDTSQDYVLVSSSEIAGSTIIEFTRSLNTGDLDDYDLDDGVGMYLLWAMGAADYTGGRSDYHSGFRGISTATIEFGVSSVPVPAAVWLMGTAVLGLAGMRHKKATV